MTGSYLDDTLGAFLDRVADRQPAPGGGAVAAIAVSLAASLVVMTARFSVGLMDAREVGSGGRFVDEAEALRVRAAALADDDAQAYGAVIAAYALARESADASVGQQAIRTAMVRATEIPLEIASVGAETARLAALLVSEGKQDLQGDAVTALLLAAGATRSAAQLVRINVAAVGGDEDLSSRAGSHAAMARVLLDRLDERDIGSSA